MDGTLAGVSKKILFCLLICNLGLTFAEVESIKCKYIDVSGSESGRYKISDSIILYWRKELQDKEDEPRDIFKTGHGASKALGWRIGKSITLETSIFNSMEDSIDAALELEWNGTTSGEKVSLKCITEEDEQRELEKYANATCGYEENIDSNKLLAELN